MQAEPRYARDPERLTSVPFDPGGTVGRPGTVADMCDYCGCRTSGPTAELAAEHVELQELTTAYRAAKEAGHDPGPTFTRLVDLLALHAAKEEVGLFPQVRELTILDEQLDELVHEHERLHDLLGDGPAGRGVDEGLKLLAQHIDDEEHDLFPHVIHALDPEQWDEITLAHLAVEEAFGVPHHHDHDHGHDHVHGQAQPSRDG